jgi:hypothetical protein
MAGSARPEPRLIGKMIPLAWMAGGIFHVRPKGF